MVALFSVLSLLILSKITYAAVISTTTTATPTSCAVPTYPTFSLKAVRQDTGAVYPVRLIARDSTSASELSMIVDTNSSCTSCGQVPTTWNLGNQVLSAEVSGTLYINDPVGAGSSPSFHVGISDVLIPVYCAFPGTSATNAPQLAVNGHADLFTMCAFTSMFPYPTIFTITYKRSLVQPVGESCFPVTLEMDH